MAKQPNLKIGIGADTSDFEKGAKSVKQGLSDLSKTGSQALSSLGEAFGVNTGKVGQMTSAIRGLGQRLSECGNAGVSAFGNILKAIGPVGGAIAGLGLTAAIAGFKQLKAEADNFKSTVDGMNMSMATSAYLSTYRQVLHDVNSDTGRQVAEAMDQWERGFGRLRANLGAALTVGMADSKWYDAFLPTGLIRGYRAVSAASAEANERAEKAAELGAEQAEQMKEQLALDYEIKQIDSEIAALRRDASDKSKSAAEREAARVAYLDKVNEKYDKQADLASRMAATQEALDDLAANSYEDTRKTYEMKGRILEIDTNRQNELKAIDKLGASIAGSAGSEAASREKARKEVQQMLDYMAARTDMNMTAGMLAGGPMLQSGVVGPSMDILLHPKVDKSEVIDLSKDLANLVEQGTLSVSESIGNLIGDLVTGGDAWSNFANSAMAAFGDMAIAVGKLAIGTGVATLGIKKALESMNGYVAIAAGAALVALGTAVKSGLSNVASGDYGASSGGYSGGYGSGSSGNGYETRDVTVNVTGTLEADGDKLITVIQSTNRRNYYTQ